jgi:hypothetical protein
MRKTSPGPQSSAAASSLQIKCISINHYHFTSHRIILTEMQRLTTCAAKGSIFSIGMLVHKPNQKAQRISSWKCLGSLHQSGYKQGTIPYASSKSDITKCNFDM